MRVAEQLAIVAWVVVGAACPACTQDGAASNVQFDFAMGMPTQVSPGLTPSATDLPTNVHVTFYAIDTGSDGSTSLFAVTDFEIHHLVDLTSPCFIDVGPNAPHPGLHVSQYAKVIGEDVGIPDVANPPANATEADKITAATAVQRERDVDELAGPNGMIAVTSSSPATYGAVAADCDAASAGIPPPTCTDEVSNRRRLDACQAAWRAAPAMFEGTDLVLTSPLNGTTYGMVDGTNPTNLGLVGGAQLFSDVVLDGVGAYAVYWQYDDANGDGVPDAPPGSPAATSPLGTLLLFGTPTTPTRGVVHVHMTSPDLAGVSAEVAIFPNLDEDDVQF